MKEKVSSEFTYLRKLYPVGFLIGLIAVLFLPNLDIYGKTISSIICVVGMYVLFSTSLELKDAEIDEHYMYVTDSRGTIQIPLLMIKAVRESIFGVQKNVIIVELKIETRFGSTIKFVPNYFFGWPLLQNPIINQLKQLADIEKNS
ncbi:MAG: hypothetical protein HZB50_17590 [Chloroflexi bacterium]|nr:hypothetical protein [Chloroflexota bacterium]